MLYLIQKGCDNMKKLILTALANYLIVLGGVVLFILGAGVWLFFLLFHILFIYINYSVAYNKKNLIILNVNLLIATALAHLSSNHLYYAIISSDGPTLLVGYLGLGVGIGIVLISSLISVLLKRNKE